MLRDEGFEVWGLDKKSAMGSFPGKEYIPFDLSEGKSIGRLLSDVKPSFIIHLAAQSSAGQSIHEPLRTIRSNILPTLYIMDAMRSRSLSARLLAIGSAEEYGPVEGEGVRLKETQASNPVNPYALSKVLQNQCCRSYAALYNVDVVITRSFNHTGPGQEEIFVLPSFTRQIIEIKRGLRPPVIEVGDLDVKRDFLDVRDAARAYIALMREGKRGEVYNVCAGTSYNLKTLLDSLCERAGITVDVQVKEERIRPVDTRELLGDNSKIKSDTGWEPKIPIEETLESLLRFWEKEIGSSAEANTD
jgi:GDP-4-dehydro-6-deoxy-D-mannose reductase